MTHRIQKQVLELDIPSGGDSWRFQNELRDTFNELVLPRLEKACNEMGVGKDTVIKIDSLLLDTGEISRHGLTTEWVKAIEYQFREQIRLVKAQGKSQIHEVEIQSTEESELNLVLHYLKLGVLPWWAQQNEKLDLSGAIEKLTEEQPAALLSGLKRQSNKALAIKRLKGILTAASFKKLQHHLGIKSPLNEQLNDWVNAQAIDMLELVEFEEVLVNANADAKTVYYQWLVRLMKHYPADFDRTISKIKALSIKSLNSQNKVSLEKNTQSSLLAAYERLKAENKVQVHTVNSAKNEQKNQLRAKENSQVNRTDQYQAEARFSQHSKSDKKDASERSNTTQANSPKDQISTSEQDLKISSKSDIDSEAVIDDSLSSSSDPQQKSAPSSERTDGPTPMSAEDQHVFKQLEKIRAAAKKRQNEQPAENEGTVEKAEAKAPGVEDAMTENRDSSIRDSVKNQGKERPEQSLKKSNPQSGKTNPTQDEEATHLKSDSALKDQKEALNQASEPHEAGTQSKASEVKAGDAPQNGETAKAELSLSTEREMEETSHYPYDLSRIEEVEECYIENAGLVLFWPFLGRFFTNVGLMEDGAFLSLQHQERAAVYLQYLLGDDPSLEEFTLPLNKLLCALPIEHPLTYAQPINEKEKEFCQELLQSTIENWSSLRGTSIPGFQGSFLNRQAVLKKQENGWLLQVEKMAFDMLLEQLPWPVSIVKLTWMEQPIYVEW